MSYRWPYHPDSPHSMSIWPPPLHSSRSDFCQLSDRRIWKTLRHLCFVIATQQIASRASLHDYGGLLTVWVDVCFTRRHHIGEIVLFVEPHFLLLFELALIASIANIPDHWNTVDYTKIAIVTRFVSIILRWQRNTKAKSTRPSWFVGHRTCPKSCHAPSTVPVADRIGLLCA